MTARTTRECYGVQLTKDAFEPTPREWKSAAVLVGVMLFVIAVVWQRNRASDLDVLIANRCQFHSETADGLHLWACHDGLRVSSVPGDAL